MLASNTTPSSRLLRTITLGVEASARMLPQQHRPLRTSTKKATALIMTIWLLLFSSSHFVASAMTINDADMDALMRLRDAVSKFPSDGPFADYWFRNNSDPCSQPMWKGITPADQLIII
jgi:hypothetical protein